MVATEHVGLRRLLHAAMRRSRELALPQAAVDIQKAIDQNRPQDGAAIALTVLRRYDPGNSLIQLIDGYFRT